MDNLIKIAIKDHTRDFLRSRLNGIQKIKLSDIEINPFLLAAMKNQLNMKKQKDLARWLVTQRIERGLVTSFGLTLQKIAKEFSDEPTTPGFTMTLRKNGKKYNISITSGPNPYAKGPMIDLRNKLLESKKTDPGSIPIFGMCYGDDDSLSSIVKNELTDVQYYVGRRFWEFISGNKNCRDEIIKIIYDMASHFQDLEKRTIQKITDSKIKQLEESLKDRYGRNPNKFWKSILKDLYI